MGLGFWVWAAIVLFWFVAAAIIVYVDVVIIDRRIRKIIDECKRGEQKYINKQEALAMQARAQRLPAWLEKIDAEWEDEK